MASPTTDVAPQANGSGARSARTPAQFLAEMRATTMHSNGNGTTPTGASSGYFSGLMGSGDSAGLSEIGNEDASNGPRLISEASIVNRMYAGAMMQSRNSSDELKSSLCSEDAGATQEMDAIVAMLEAMDNGNPTFWRLVSLAAFGEPEDKAYAANALRRLTEDPKQMEMTRSGLQPLIALLGRGGPVAQTYAAAGLRYMSFLPENKRTIPACGGIPPLAAVCCEGGEEAQLHAVATLHNIMLLDENLVAVMESGAVAGMVEIAKSHHYEAKANAAMALRVLAEHSDTRNVLLEYGAVQGLLCLIHDVLTMDYSVSETVKSLDEYSLQIAERILVNATDALNSLSFKRHDVQKQIVELEGVPSLVHLLQLGRDEETISSGRSPPTEPLSPKEKRMQELDAITVSHSAAILLKIVANVPNSHSDVVSCGAIPYLVDILANRDTDEETKASVAGVLGNLAANNRTNQLAISKHNGIRHLCDTVACQSLDARSYAAATLGNLAANNTENQDAIVVCGGIKPLVALLYEGNPEGQSFAAAALANLAANAAAKDVIINEGAVKHLVAIVQSNNKSVCSNAAACINNLAANDIDKQNIMIDAGVLVPLVNLTEMSDNAEGSSNAAAALLKFAAIPAAKDTIIEAGGVFTAVELVKNGSQEAKINAASLIARLAANEEEVPLQVVDWGGLAPLVQLLRSEREDARIAGCQAMVSISVEDNLGSVAAAGAVIPLVEAVKSSNPALQAAGSLALRNMCAGGGVIQLAIADAGGIEGLVELLKSDDDEITFKAADALRKMAAQCNPNKLRIQQAGAIDLLAAVLKEGNPVGSARVAACLGNLASHESNHESIIASGIIPYLVKLVDQGYPEARVNAAGTLWNLSISPAIHSQLVDAGMIVDAVRDGAHL